MTWESQRREAYKIVKVEEFVHFVSGKIVSFTFIHSQMKSICWYIYISFSKVNVSFF